MNVNKKTVSENHTEQIAYFDTLNRCNVVDLNV